MKKVLILLVFSFLGSVVLAQRTKTIKTVHLDQKEYISFMTVKVSDVDSIKNRVTLVWHKHKYKLPILPNYPVFVGDKFIMSGKKYKFRKLAWNELIEFPK